MFATALVGPTGRAGLRNIVGRQRYDYYSTLVQKRGRAPALLGVSRESRVDYVNSHGHGVDLFCTVIAKAEPRLQFFKLPYPWPASVLFRNAGGPQHGDAIVPGHAISDWRETGGWIPIRIRTTTTRTRSPTRREGRALFEFCNRSAPLGLHDFFISVAEQKFFVRPDANRSYDGAHALFQETDAVEPSVVVSRLQDILRMQPTSLPPSTSIHNAIEALLPVMNPQAGTQCRMYLELEDDFYSALGLPLIFRSLVAGFTCGVQVGPYNILHRIVARQERGCSGRIIRYSAFGGSKGERPYRPEEVKDLDFVCVADLPESGPLSHKLRGFHMLPNDMFTDMLYTPTQKGKVNRPMYSPFCCPKRPAGRKWQERCTPFYISMAPEQRRSELQKLKEILEGHQPGRSKIKESV